MRWRWIGPLRRPPPGHQRDTGDSPRPVTDLAAAVEGALLRRFDIRIGVVVRSRAQWLQVLAKDPFRDIVTDDSRYLVSFSAQSPDTADDDGRLVVLGDERYLVDGSETYFWCPGGISDSPMLAADARKTGLRIVSTTRNWSTVRKVAALL